MTTSSRKSILLALVLGLGFAAFGSATATAAQCRDDKGKFIKCPPAASAPATKCRDKSGTTWSYPITTYRLDKGAS